jgi:spore coat protein A
MTAATFTGAMLTDEFLDRTWEQHQAFMMAPAKPIVHSPHLTHFIDPLPVPQPIQPIDTYKGYPLYDVNMKQTIQELHAELPLTTVWGYNGTVPGPFFDLRANSPIYINWRNNLPTKHLLPIDHTLHGCMDGTPDVRTVVHVHGMRIAPADDGYADDWFTPGQSKLDFYPNNQLASTYYYHDHTVGITRLNIYAGLSGMYIIRDEMEDGLNLPRGPYEIPLSIQDRTFNYDGQLYYPDKGVSREHPVWVPLFYGDMPLINGKLWPYLDVEPRKYRFRILNSCNARFLHLTLSSKQKFYQIGGDGGLLPRATNVSPLVLAPGERADVILDFSRMQGKTITLENKAAPQFPGGGMFNIPELMQFRVHKALSAPDHSSVPYVVTGLPLYADSPVSKVRNLVLDENMDAQGHTINLLLNGLPFDAPTTEKPVLGSTELWQFINLTRNPHPMHLHLVQFQVIDRQPIDVQKFKATGELVYLKGPHECSTNETGLKDVVVAIPSSVTRIKARFVGYTGKYLWHCHILEHEDNDMMRPFEVIPAE